MASYEKYAEIRDLIGLNDSKVARLCGFGRSTFTDWKVGRSFPKAEKLQKIANALGVSYAELVGLEDIEKTPVPKFEPEFHRVIALFSQLSEDERQIIIDTMTRFVASHK